MSCGHNVPKRRSSGRTARHLRRAAIAFWVTPTRGSLVRVMIQDAYLVPRGDGMSYFDLGLRKYPREAISDSCSGSIKQYRHAVDSMCVQWFKQHRGAVRHARSCRKLDTGSCCKCVTNYVRQHSAGDFG